MARTGTQSRGAEVGVRLGSDSDVSLTDTWSSAFQVRADSGSPCPRGPPETQAPSPGIGMQDGEGTEGAHGPSSQELLTVLQGERRAETA